METELAIVKQRMDDYEKRNSEEFTTLHRSIQETKNDIMGVIRSSGDGVTRAQVVQMELIGEMKKAVDRTEIQATKTNGRVNSLEDINKVTVPDVTTLMKFRWMIAGGIAVLLFLIGAMGFMAVNWINEVNKNNIMESEYRQREYINDKLSTYEVPAIRDDKEDISTEEKGTKI